MFLLSKQQSHFYRVVQTSEEEEGKGDREDKEEVNEDEDGEDTCKEWEEDKHVLTIQL